MTKLTDEQKAKFGPMLQNTWQAIGPDAEPLLSRGRGRQGELIEMTIDANRPEMYGGMSSEDYKILSASWRDCDTMKWLRKVLNY